MVKGEELQRQRDRQIETGTETGEDIEEDRFDCKRRFQTKLSMLPFNVKFDLKTKKVVITSNDTI